MWRPSSLSRAKTRLWILSAAKFVEVYQSRRVRDSRYQVYLWRLEMVARFQQPVAAMLLHHRPGFVIDYNTFGERIYL